MPPPKRKLIPPLRPNADGTGFVRLDKKETLSADQTNKTDQMSHGSSADVRGAGASRNGRGQRGRVTHRDVGVMQSAQGRRAQSTKSSESLSSSSSNSTEPAAFPAGASAHRGDTCTKTEKQKETASLSNRKSRETERPPVLHSGARSLCPTNVKLFTATDASLYANECRVPPSVLRQLGVGSGSLLRLSTDDSSSCSPSVFLEAFLSTSCARDSIVVTPETKSVLLESLPAGASTSHVTVSSVQVAVVPSLSWITLSVFVDSESELLSRGTDARDLLTADACAEWRALFRHTFRNRTVYRGMRASLRSPSAHSIVCEVNAVTPIFTDGNVLTSQQLTCGVLSAATEIILADGVDGEPACMSEGEAAVPSATDGEQTGTTHVSSLSSAHTLVLGEAGTGKSYYLRQQAAVIEDGDFGQRVFTIRVEDLPQGDGSEVATATALREMLASVKCCAPSTVFIDDLHLLCGSRATSTGSGSVASAWAVALLTATLCDELRDITVRKLPVRVVASAPSRDALDSSLCTPDRLGGQVVQLSSPATAEDRERCLLSCLCAMSSDADAVPLDAVRDVAVNGHGYTQRDLHRVVEAAMMESFRKRGTTLLDGADLRAAAKVIHPSSLRQFEVNVPEVTWDDIGGSEVAKRTLQEVVAWCLGKQSWVFTEFNLTPPKGVLLYGPPGCSKTMLAKALANESKMNFVSVKGPEVFSKWVGDSEKAVRDIFFRARAAAPCVVFIDELDGMCGHRGRGGVSDRVISQFLTELDGLPSAMQQETATGKQSKALVFVAATNRPDNIDGAVLRPGRIDRRVHVGLPELAEREAIVRIQFSKLPTHPDLTPTFVAERTEQYTGAEVVAVVKEAAFTAISNDMAASCVTCADVERALLKVRPRVDKKDVEWYKNWPTPTPANPFLSGDN